MNPESHDPRDIPVLTEAIDQAKTLAFSINAKDVAAAIMTETLKLADSLLHQAAKDIEATLFEHVFDRLRAELPELVDRILTELSLAEPESARAPAAEYPPQV
jgi:Zn-dependent M32 family carboxypeptidase